MVGRRPDVVRTIVSMSGDLRWVADFVVDVGVFSFSPDSWSH